MMNEELLAASALLAQSAPSWSVLLVLSTFLLLSNVKPTQVFSAPEGCQVISTILAAPQREL
jgi:hypothetical protein